MSDNKPDGTELAVPDEDHLEAAERSRLAARRRFLKGGALALPLILSVNRETFAHYQGYGHNHDDDDERKVGRSLCASIGVKKDSYRNTHNSTVCKINKS